MKVNPVRMMLSLLALACALSFMTACPRNRDGTPGVTGEQLRGGARVVKTAAEEFSRELAAEVKAGALSEADNASVQPIVGEIVTLSGKLAEDPRDFESLKTAERRQLVVDYVSALNDSAVRLNDAGALRLKSEAARKHFDKATNNIRRGLSLARIALAALPPAEQAPR